LFKIPAGKHNTNMKRNMLATMDRLRIDGGVRELVGQLWKHHYKTVDSCEGPNLEAYEDFVDRRKTCGCGAGVNGYYVYRGTLIQNPFKPEF